MIFSCEAQDDATRAFMQHSSVEVRGPISKVTMPLFAEEGGIGYLCATGVLLGIQDAHFLLTAAHVFDNWATRPIPLHVTDGVAGNPLFPVGEVTLRRSPTANPVNRLADDPFDACVCDISKDAAERILSGNRFRFMGLAEVDPWGELDPRDWFTVFGFPGALNQTDASARSLGSNANSFATFLYLGERGDIPWSEADQGVGILMDYGPTTTRDDAGQVVLPPHPGGMSGGGMWRTVQYGCETEGWTTGRMRLIGIQSAVYEHQHVLRGTRIEHALGMIYRGRPELRQEMDSHFGEERCRLCWT